MEKFWLCFVPIFVAMDAIGNLPLFVSMTGDLDRKKVYRIIFQSLWTAGGVALAFLFGGKWILSWLGIGIPDFLISGGILLFLFAMKDLLTYDLQQRAWDLESLGAVPFGVPLLVGPGVLTALLLLSAEHGFFPTTLALLVNIILGGGAFFFGAKLYSILGKAGSKIISKIAALLLAAIAIMMIRKGLTTFIQSL